MIFLQLFWEFFKIGLFAVGGGLAMLPFMSDLAVNTGWFSPADLGNIQAMGEITPGPVGVDFAVYVGFKMAGVPGVIAAVLGLVTPSLIIVLAVASFIKAYYSNRHVQAAFYGVRPVSTALIAAAALFLFQEALINWARYSATHQIMDLLKWKAVALAILIAVVSNIKFFKKLHPAVFLLVGAVAGIA